MQVYVFQADIYCSECGEAIIKRLACDVPLDERDDSDRFPQGPYADGGGEADSPQHCADCGVFLENPLTGEGYDYVREAAANSDSASGVVREWLDFYELV